MLKWAWTRPERSFQNHRPLENTVANGLRAAKARALLNPSSSSAWGLNESTGSEQEGAFQGSFHMEFLLSDDGIYFSILSRPTICY